MVRTVARCENCRRLHRKCVPNNRRWDPDGGIQEKCEHCIKGDSPCSVSKRVERGHTKRAQQAQAIVTMASVEPAIESRAEERKSIGSARDGEVIFGQRSICDDQDLERLLKAVDYKMKMFKEVQHAINWLQQQTPPPLDDAYGFLKKCDLLCKTMEDTRVDLYTKLGTVGFLADQFARNGDANTAERAYLRALQGYDSPPFNRLPAHRELLLKVAKFYCEKGNYVQEEMYLEQVLRLPDIPRPVRDETLEKMVESKKSSCQEMTKLFHLDTGHEFQNIVPVPFQPLHGMMRLGDAFTYSGDLARFELIENGFDLTGHPPLHNAVVARLPIASDLIQDCDDSELTRRDEYGKTLLFHSALFKLEGFGKELLNRFAKLDPETRKIRMNERDYFGRTILAVAISSDCSLEFIRLLVANETDVNPDLYEHTFTPLQAAARYGRLDVVQYLLDCGANSNDTLHGDLTALGLAFCHGHLDIVRALQPDPPSTS